jgi:hypothetical protein
LRPRKKIGRNRVGGGCPVGVDLPGLDYGAEPTCMLIEQYDS